MNAINIVYGDDWCSLYLNDKLIDEGHELSLKSYLGIVRMYHINAEEIYHTKFQYLNQEGIEYTENRGCFPEKYENIKKYIDMEVSA